MFCKWQSHGIYLVLLQLDVMDFVNCLFVAEVGEGIADDVDCEELNNHMEMSFFLWRL